MTLRRLTRGAAFSEGPARHRPDRRLGWARARSQVSPPTARGPHLLTTRLDRGPPRPSRPTPGSRPRRWCRRPRRRWSGQWRRRGGGVALVVAGGSGRRAAWSTQAKPWSTLRSRAVSERGLYATRFPVRASRSPSSKPSSFAIWNLERVHAHAERLLLGDDRAQIGFQLGFGGVQIGFQLGFGGA